MIKLSVNINKIATLRNARGGNAPDLIQIASDIQSFGANGITVHPRPDERHIRYNDISALKPIVTTEFNIEGNPIKKFIDLVLKTKPDQVTLVPDGPDNITSDSGWDTKKNKSFLKEVVSEFKRNGIRTSIFLDPDISMVESAKETGTDRIELYTESYAVNYSKDKKMAIKKYLETSLEAKKLNLGINAGHDLSLDNIEYFSEQIPFLSEVSIGHALICESLYFGIDNVVKMYLAKLNK